MRSCLYAEPNRGAYQIAVALLQIQALDGHNFVERDAGGSVHCGAHTLPYFLQQLVARRHNRVGFPLLHDSTQVGETSQKTEPVEEITPCEPQMNSPQANRP